MVHLYRIRYSKIIALSRAVTLSKRGSWTTCPASYRSGVPTGIRTPVTAVKGRCPRPLDDGDCGTQETIDRIYATYRIKPSLQILLILLILSIRVMLVEVSGIEPLTSCMPCKRSPS